MKQLSEMSTEELNQQQNLMKTTTGLMIGLFLALVAASIFLTLQRGFTVFTMLPLFFLPLFLLLAVVNFNKSKKIRAELNLRG